MAKQLEKFKKIEYYFSKNNWKKARDLLLNQLKKDHSDHWVLANIGISYYEQQKYRTAYKYLVKASYFAPDCPLVLWYMANIIVHLNNKEDAIRILRLLLRKDIEELAYDECGEGLRWAQSLKNDCRYKLGTIYLESNNKKLGLKYLKEHLKNRKPGLPSVYKLADVKRKLNSL